LKQLLYRGFKNTSVRQHHSPSWRSLPYQEVSLRLNLDKIISFCKVKYAKCVQETYLQMKHKLVL
jgi:hypothetical protein